MLVLDQTDELETKARLLKAKITKQGLEDLYFFNKSILGYSDMTPEIHGELCDFVEKVKNPKNAQFRLILEPRGSLKSSCITIGFTTQSIVEDPNIRILLASEEFSASKKFLAEIKGHFEENQVFKSYYGDWVSKKKWDEKEIIVNRRTRWRKEPTITCAGIDVTKTGMHYDMIIVDDPHSSKNITTREQIEKVKTWYKLLLSLLDPGGVLIVIGTRWHYDDLFGYLIDQEQHRKETGRRKRFRILKKSAFNGSVGDLMAGRLKDKDLLWPSRLSIEFLQDQYLDQGPYIFSCQYGNEPVDDESAVFKRSWVKFIDPAKLDSLELGPKKAFQIVDPARDEDGKDFTTIVTCQLLHNWQAIIREVRRGKWDEHETIDQMFRAYKKWKPQKIGFETVAFQKTYLRFIKAEMLRKGRVLPIVELKTDSTRSKVMRIKGMVPYWKQGLFLVPGHSISLLTGNMKILVDELTRFPKVSNDDCIDALAYMDQIMRRPMVSKITKAVPKGSFYGMKKLLKKKRNGKLGQFNMRSA
jgi:hypothetical protein